MTANSNCNVHHVTAGYSEPYGIILGPMPPKDKSDWTFTYGCETLETLEQPDLWLEVKSTGGQSVANISNSTYNNETCLFNSTYIGGKIGQTGYLSMVQQ